MLIGLGLGVLVAMVAVMSLAWAVSLRLRNGGWTDVFWTFGTGVTLALVALAPDSQASAPRQILAAGIVVLWTIRLGGYLTPRVATHSEDARYARFREEWGDAYALKMLGVSLAQPPATALIALSVIAAAHLPESPFRLRDIAAAVVFTIALAGEAVADIQMRRFKSDPANKGKVCDTGLWAWSRHPNYVFEWLGWLAWPVMALTPGHPTTGLTLIAPAVMYLLLTRVSGVPPLEDAMLRSKGDAYRDYQAQVPRFFPLPPRKPLSARP